MKCLNSWGKVEQEPRLRPGIGAKITCLNFFELIVILIDQIKYVYSVELVVQEHEEGGPIVAITPFPDFKPQNHQMSSLNVFQFPPEAISLFKKLQIDFNGEKGSL